MYVRAALSRTYAAISDTKWCLHAEFGPASTLPTNEHEPVTHINKILLTSVCVCVCVCVCVLVVLCVCVCVVMVCVWWCEPETSGPLS